MNINPKSRAAGCPHSQQGLDGAPEPGMKAARVPQPFPGCGLESAVQLWPLSVARGEGLS